MKLQIECASLKEQQITSTQNVFTKIGSTREKIQLSEMAKLQVSN